jgi:hypothetical protein
MTLDIALMALVGLLFMVVCAVGFVERTMSSGRSRSHANADVLSGIARVEQRVSQTGGDFVSRWDYPKQAVRRTASER